MITSAPAPAKARKRLSPSNTLRARSRSSHLVHESLPRLEVPEALRWRAPEVLAEQGPIHSALVGLDHRVGGKGQVAVQGRKVPLPAAGGLVKSAHGAS